MTDTVLRYSDDELLLRDACRTVLQRDFPTSWVRSVMATNGPWPEQWSKFSDLGWTGLTVPETHGGLGFGLRELSVVAEEFGRAVQPGPFLASSVVALAAAELGGTSSSALDLTALATGDLVGTWSVDVEGSDGTVTAVPDSRRAGAWRLCGTRSFVPDADHASILMIDASEGEQQRLFVVPLDANGVTTRAHVTADLGRRYSQLQFDHVVLDSASVLTTRDSARQWLANAGTVVQCAESLGAAEHLVEMTVTFALQRHQFGRAIGSFQAIKHRIADMRIRVQAGRAAVRYAAWAVAAHRPDATRAVHVAKQWIGESTSWVAGEALQVHGGIGFTWEHDLHLYLRRLKANELTLGTPDWHSQRLGDWCLCPQSGGGA